MIRSGGSFDEAGVGSRLAAPSARNHFGLAGVEAFLLAVVAALCLTDRLPVVVLVAAVPAVVIATVVPRHFLPAAALIFYSLVPFQAIPDLSPLAHPGFMLMFLWGARLTLERRADSEFASSPVRTRAVATCLLLFLLWGVVLVVLRSQVNSVFWLVEVAVMLTPLCSRAAAADDARKVLPLFLLLSAGTSGYAVVEFVLQRNPIFDPIYLEQGLSYANRWSVYRSHASFGHPLYASTFFAVASNMFFARWLERGGTLLMTGMVLTVAGMISTVSRGAVLATALGALVVLAANRGRTGMARPALAVIGGALAGTFLVSRLLGARAESSEGVSSAGVRSAVLDISWRASKAVHHLGWGPATSRESIARFNPAHYVLENSYLQLLVSMGVVGVALFVAFAFTVLRLSLRRRNALGAGAWVAFVVSILGYNALEAQPTFFLLGAFLVLFATGLPLDRDGATDASLQQPLSAAYPSATMSSRRSASATADRAGRVGADLG